MENRKDFRPFLSGEVGGNWGEYGGGTLYEFVKKNTASLSDNMKKIVETNKHGYQIKSRTHLTRFIRSLHLVRNCM